MITEYQDIQSFQAMDYSESRKELEQIKEIARKELYELVDKGEKAQFLELFQEQENRGWLHLKDLEVLADIAAAGQGSRNGAVLAGRSIGGTASREAA